MEVMVNGQAESAATVSAFGVDLDPQVLSA